MTTPPIEPPEPPEPSEPSESSDPFRPPEHPMGPPPVPGPSPRRYETGTLTVAAVLTLVVITGLTWINPVLGLLAPLVLIVALFFIRANASPRRRSIVTGVILGSGIGLLTTAGICTGILNGSSTG